MSELGDSFIKFLQREGRGDGSSLEMVPGASAPEPFSAFNPEHMARVTDVLRELDAIMRNAPDMESGAAEALQLAEQLVLREGLSLVQHALGIFAVHAGKSFPGVPRLPVPPLAFKRQRSAAPVPGQLEALVTAGLAGEDRLHWFREDLFLNEHHRHWHFVYPTSGVFLNGQLRLKSRQGEIFLYMHQQMLARYDTERISVGLSVVEPLDDLADGLGEGYDPNAREPAEIGYLSRPDDSTMPANQQTQLNQRKQAFLDTLSTGQVNGNAVTLTTDRVGALLESNHGFFGATITTQNQLDQQNALLGSSYHLHNIGHGVIAGIPLPGNRVMNNPHTSLQDPIFWRWHRMIDDLGEAFRRTLPAHEFTNAPSLLVRDAPSGSPDLLVLGEQLLRSAGVDLDAPDRDIALTSHLEPMFGEAQWDTPIDPATISSELSTGSLLENFSYRRTVFDSQTGAPVAEPVLDFSREHLISERFVTLVRVENTSSASQSATLRIFLCAEDFLDLGGGPPDHGKRAVEHRFWIELERKAVTVVPGKNIFINISDESSIVRKLEGRAPWPTSSFSEEDFGDQTSGQDAEDDYCDCGWPLNLQLPRGHEDGMAFRLMAMISEGAAANGDGNCGSRSFCGAGFDSYPELDEVNLGYPFDRPATDGTVSMIANASNMAMRSITIRHLHTLAQDMGVTP